MATHPQYEEAMDSETTLFAVADDLTDRTIANRADVFAALGNETRLRIVHLLAAADDGVPVGELADQLPVSQSTTSQYLSDLRSAGLVTRRKVDRWRYYSLTPLADALLEALEAERE